jgi:hypothetical protein
MTEILKVHFDGRFLVPDEPVDLPVGCSLVVQVVRARADEPGRKPLAKLAEPARSLPADPGAPREPMLYDLLILGPNVGEDADFERRRHPPRELPEWGT